MLGIGLEADLGRTFRATGIETDFRNGEVFFISRFFANIEFATPTDVFSTTVASYQKRGRESNSLPLGNIAPCPWLAREPTRVEIRWIIFGLNLSFRHFALKRSGL